MHPYDTLAKKEQINRLKEIAFVFFKLGFFAYGGPAAHTAMMNEELVEKRQWVTQDQFLDLMSATNIIPGPNSTELAIAMGYQRGKIKGLVIAGICFILPAFCLVLLLAIIYNRYSQIPQIKSILLGITPIIIAVIFQALFKLMGSAIRSINYLILLPILLILIALGVNELFILIIGAIYLILSHFVYKYLFSISFPVLLVISQTDLFLKFLKIGSILYGSGYVLVAYLERIFVSTQLLTSQQLIDAISIGQMTPGPVFTTATFIGYQLGGVTGAILSTLGIFLPSFILVSFLVKITEIARKHTIISKALDGVNVASLALMISALVNISINSFGNTLSIYLSIVAFILLRFFKVNSVYLILIGGIIGYFFY